MNVEDFVGEYYLIERNFDYYLLNSACVYGGLLWVLFHDILFHNNLEYSHPLQSLFYYKPYQGYLRFKEKFESRLIEFSKNRYSFLQNSYQSFYQHPLFKNESGNRSQYYGKWLIQNENMLLEFCKLAPEHGMEDLIREILITSYHGVNKGWPDLVVWNKDHIIFAEVKVEDNLSSSQITWLKDHFDLHKIELIRVKNINFNLDSITTKLKY